MSVAPRAAGRGTFALAARPLDAKLNPMVVLRLPGLLAVALLLGRPMLCGQTTPALSSPLPAQALTVGVEATLDLKDYFSLPGVTGQVVQIDTVLGTFNVEVFAADTPKTAINFLGYTDYGDYDSSIIHRSVPGFVIQGGGYKLSNNTVSPIATAAAIPNEFKRSNVRGTLAMAKTPDGPDTATSQWFVNLADNSANLDQQNGGFTVFARVLGTGMSVVDQIAAVNVYDASAQLGAAFDRLPVLRDSLSQENLIIVRSVKRANIYPDTPAAATAATAATPVPTVLAFSATASNSSAVQAEIEGTKLTLTPVRAGSVTVTVTATDTNGNVASGGINVVVATEPVRPSVTAQPQPLIALASGSAGTVVLSVQAVGVPAPIYQWRRNGVAIAGATSPLLVLTAATAAQAGNYTCLVSNSYGSVESLPSVLAFVPTTNPGHLTNLSVLTDLAAGENLTLGTVLGGGGTSGSKALLVRAAGPSLAQFSVTGVLPDPQLALLAAAGAPIAANDNWNGDAALAAAFLQTGAFAFTSTASKDAALLQTGASALPPGNCTVQVSDTGAGAGKVIAEIYDATSVAAFTAATPRLINVSVLKRISAGGTLTAGFVIGGTTYKTVLVRAIGPGIAAAPFNVAGALTDPRLALFSGENRIAENDNWGGDAQLTALGTRVGAFAIASAASKDAILVATLGPGNYTAQATSADGAAGSVLVEVYEVP